MTSKITVIIQNIYDEEYYKNKYPVGLCLDSATLVRMIGHIQHIFFIPNVLSRSWNLEATVALIKKIPAVEIHVRCFLPSTAEPEIVPLIQPMVAPWNMLHFTSVFRQYFPRMNPNYTLGNGISAEKTITILNIVSGPADFYYVEPYMKHIYFDAELDTGSLWMTMHVVRTIRTLALKWCQDIPSSSLREDYIGYMNRLFPDICFTCHRRERCMKCGRCLVALYCSTDCQRQDWINHKKTCNKDDFKREKEALDDIVTKWRESLSHSKKVDPTTSIF